MLPAASPSTPHILRLYRLILTEHKRRLPRDFRELGDQYVRDEFRRMREFAGRNAAEQRAVYERAASEFLAQWRSYVAQLDRGGRALDAHTRQSLNEEQRTRLDELRRSSTAHAEQASERDRQ